MTSRRSFFGTLLAPLVARLLPKRVIPPVPLPFIPMPPLLDTTCFLPKIYSVEIPFYRKDIVSREMSDFALDRMNSAWERMQILDAGGRIIGQFGRMPGGSWFRLSGGMQWPDTAPRLPA